MDKSIKISPQAYNYIDQYAAKYGLTKKDAVDEIFISSEKLNSVAKKIENKFEKFLASEFSKTRGLIFKDYQKTMINNQSVADLLLKKYEYTIDDINDLIDVAVKKSLKKG